ncbi:hypothetical protein ACTFIR_001094 [Dictyostelium discoideum]
MLNYNCRKYKVCPHENLTFEGAVKAPLMYLEILKTGDNFPYLLKDAPMSVKKNNEITPSSYLSVVSGCEKKKDFEHGFDFSVELNEDGSFPDYPNTLDS